MPNCTPHVKFLPLILGVVREQELKKHVRLLYYNSILVCTPHVKFLTTPLIFGVVREQELKKHVKLLHYNSILVFSLCNINISIDKTKTKTRLSEQIEATNLAKNIKNDNNI